jgi:hypothetical protein
MSPPSRHHRPTTDRRAPSGAGLGWIAGLLFAGCLSEYAVGVAGSELCPGLDLANDPDNCGDCGITCPAGQACVDGICQEMCDVGTRCERRCVDLSTDPLHCGSCEEACGPGEDCIGGECISTCDPECDPVLKVCNDGVCVCRAGLSLCNGACVDLQTDPDDCGECNTRCMGNPCAAGTCVPLCPEALTACPDGACADLGTDVLHCGDCSTPCDADQLCVGGTCQGYHLAPCEACPCDGCGDDACCPSPSGPRCISGDACP